MAEQWGKVKQFERASISILVAVVDPAKINPKGRPPGPRANSSTRSLAKVTIGRHLNM
jgi:hypothetical protein